MTFKKKWQRVVNEKNSVLCIGSDPGEHSMGRGERANFFYCLVP